MDRTAFPFLSRHFIGKLNGKMQKQIKGLRQDAKEGLMACGWPGNVRQLENVLERAANPAVGSDYHIIISSIA